MIILIQIIGVLICLMGWAFAISPVMLRGLLNFFMQGKNIYIAGVVRLILAVIFFVAASQCSVPLVLYVLAVLCFLGGILIFTLGVDRIKKILEFYQDKSDKFLRVISLLPLIIGILILYSA